MPSPRLVDHFSPEPLFRQLERILRERLAAGEIGRGDRLTENTLAAEHDIARETVRRALKVLEAEGLVRALPRRGWVVLPPQR